LLSGLIHFCDPVLSGRAKVVNKLILASFWRSWLNHGGVGSWQGPNGQAMREKWRGSVVGRARTGRRQAAALKANGLRHSRFVSHPQPLAHPAPPRPGVLAQPPRQHLLLPSSLRRLGQLHCCQFQRRQPARQPPLGFRLTVRPLGLAATGAASPLTQRLLHQRQQSLLELRPAHIPSPPNRFQLLRQFFPAPL
jgi:hypothetical protein